MEAIEIWTSFVSVRLCEDVNKKIKQGIKYIFIFYIIET